MREILFRGKKGDGDWAYGYYVFAPKRTGMFGQTVSSLDFDKHFILTMHYSLPKEVAPKTVGQYTGLTDKNGKKIFEGDIVEYARDEEIGQIAYHESEAMFVIEFDTWLTDFDHMCGKDLEVIGNIHDNPELLKGGEG